MGITKTKLRIAKKRGEASILECLITKFFNGDKLEKETIDYYEKQKVNNNEIYFEKHFKYYDENGKEYLTIIDELDKKKISFYAGNETYVIQVCEEVIDGDYIDEDGIKTLHQMPIEVLRDNLSGKEEDYEANFEIVRDVIDSNEFYIGSSEAPSIEQETEEYEVFPLEPDTKSNVMYVEF